MLATFICKAFEKADKIWKNVLTMTTNGVGDKQQFRPVTSSQFRLLIENKDEAPTLLEWQMYGAE